jgi:hypothetical protein
MAGMVQYPQLPLIPDDLPISAKLVEQLELLKYDDDYPTLDLYSASQSSN